MNQEFRNEIKNIVREVLKEELFGSSDTGGGRSGDFQDFDDYDSTQDEIQREAKERGIAPSQTRAYHRYKSQQSRGRDDDSSGSSGNNNGGTENRGRVTDPEHDRRLKQNRGDAA